MVSTFNQALMLAWPNLFQNFEPLVAIIRYLDHVFFLMQKNARTLLLTIISASQLTFLDCFVNLPCFTKIGLGSTHSPTLPLANSCSIASLRLQPHNLAMNDDVAEPLVDDDLQPWERERVDETDDAVFYEHPRLVYHADIEYHQR